MTLKQLRYYLDKMPNLKARDAAILAAWDKLLKQIEEDLNDWN